jgi:hypothetical protein
VHRRRLAQVEQLGEPFGVLAVVMSAEDADRDALVVDIETV